VRMSNAGKTRMMNDWATVWCKNYDDMLSRFHLVPERNGQTDREGLGERCKFPAAKAILVYLEFRKGI